MVSFSSDGLKLWKYAEINFNFLHYIVHADPGETQLFMNLVWCDLHRLLSLLALLIGKTKNAKLLLYPLSTEIVLVKCLRVNPFSCLAQIDLLHFYIGVGYLGAGDVPGNAYN